MFRRDLKLKAFTENEKDNEKSLSTKKPKVTMGDTCKKCVTNQKEMSALRAKLNVEKRNTLKAKRDVKTTSDENKSLKHDQQKLGMKDKQIKTLKANVRDLKVNQDYLQDILDDNKKIRLFDEDRRAYTPDAVHCVMDLITHGVPAGSVGSAIKTVSKLCCKEVDAVPSRRTVDIIAQRRLALSHHQLSDTATTPNQTLYTDETVKFGQQYMCYVSTGSKEKSPMVLGLKPIPTKSAQDTLHTLQLVLDSISETCEKQNLAKKYIINIKNNVGSSIHRKTIQYLVAGLPIFASTRDCGKL